MGVYGYDSLSQLLKVSRGLHSVTLHRTFAVVLPQMSTRGHSEHTQKIPLSHMSKQRLCCWFITLTTCVLGCLWFQEKVSRGWHVLGSVGMTDKNTAAPVMDCVEFRLSGPTLLLMGKMYLHAWSWVTADSHWLGEVCLL